MLPPEYPFPQWQPTRRRGGVTGKIGVVIAVAGLLAALLYFIRTGGL